MPSRVPISVWRQQGVLQWIDEEGDQVPTRAIKYFRSKGWKLDGGSVRRWWRDRAKILAADPGSLRVPGGGRRPLSAAMEEDWYDEVVAKRLKKPNVTRDWIGHMTGVIFACQHPTALVLVGLLRRLTGSRALCDGSGCRYATARILPPSRRSTRGQCCFLHDVSSKCSSCHRFGPHYRDGRDGR
ncbi:hypothetical protein PI125_g22998 [Phytophthora idaei]|nr:hypothetical protein PI125_g22998 [Phytophthora idaei]